MCRILDAAAQRLPSFASISCPYKRCLELLALWETETQGTSGKTYCATCNTALPLCYFTTSGQVRDSCYLQNLLVLFHLLTYILLPTLNVQQCIIYTSCSASFL
jgi:hypothetical protein